MPSPTATCVLPYTRLTRARLRAADLLAEQGAGGGPIRTRRRLTRAQRRPQERRNELRGAGVWQRDAEERAASVAQALREVRDAREPPRVPDDADTDSDAGSHDAFSGRGDHIGADRPQQLLDADYVHGDLRSPNPLDGRVQNGGPAAGSAASSDLEFPASPAGPPAHLHSLALSPVASSPLVPTVTAKDALQQRLILLRRRDGLIDITIRTMKLMRRNQQLQHRLMALQAETRAFVRSVLSNPENRGLRLTRSAITDTTTTTITAAALTQSSVIIQSPTTSPAVSPAVSRAASPAGSSAMSSPDSSPASTPSSSPSSSPASSPVPSPAAYTPTTC